MRINQRQFRELWCIIGAVIFLVVVMPAGHAQGAAADPAVVQTVSPGPYNPVMDDPAGSWTLVNPAAAWPVRAWQSLITLPDGTILLMGGMDNNFHRMNDVWQSTDNGTTWSVVNRHAGWSPRYGQTCVVLQGGSIVLMGGYQDDRALNDTWRSDDRGVTWARMNASSGWPERWQAGSAVLPDGSILLMGGGILNGRNLNDTWRSADRGATWTPVSTVAGWPSRRGFRSMTLADGSILILGGVDTTYSPPDVKDDVWRSTDGGETWSLMSTGNWGGRYDFSSIVMPDESILLMGGVNKSILRSNDIWRSTDTGMTWSLIESAAAWSPRYGQSTVLVPDGMVLIAGGSVFGRDGGDRNDVWRSGLGGRFSRSSADSLVITKNITPYSVKQGTDATVIIRVTNTGKTPVHDLEILDSPLPEFPVLKGDPQYSTSLLGPGESRIVTYTIHATRPGTFRFNRTQVMYADSTGNYRIVYSDDQQVVVLSPLLPLSHDRNEDLLGILFRWFGGIK